jgi:hypothetical protein
MFLSIEAAGLKVIRRHIRVHAQIDRSQVGGTRLRLFSIRLHSGPNRSPEVGLIRRVERQHKVVVGDAIKGRTQGGGWTTPACAQPMARPHRRIIIGPRVA